MQLGMFTMPLHDPARNLTDVLSEDREAVLLTDRLGMAEGWCGEHISSTAEPLGLVPDVLRLTDRADQGHKICLWRFEPAATASGASGGASRQFRSYVTGSLYHGHRPWRPDQ